MRVISLKPLREFWERHPDAEQPLRHWYKTATFAEWTCLQDARRDYPHADGVKTRVVTRSRCSTSGETSTAWWPASDTTTNSSTFAQS